MSRKKNRISQRSKTLFFKSAVITAICLLLIVLGFFSAGFVSGMIR